MTKTIKIEGPMHVVCQCDKCKAQPEQEPVAWGFRNDAGAIYDCISPETHADCEGEYTVPLYTAPPQPKQEQEPVALQYPQKEIDWQREQQIKAQSSTPPQRTWVGLEKSDMPDSPHPMYDHRYFIAGMVYANDVLKEKNT